MLVQFGNNWIQKVPLTAKLGPRPILAVLGIFFIQLFPNWTACWTGVVPDLAAAGLI